MWNLEYSSDADRDFELIFDHLFAAYIDLGDAPEDALERAAERIGELRVEIDRLVETPYIGTLRPDIYPGIRFLRRDRAAVWFLAIEARADDPRRRDLFRSSGSHQTDAGAHARRIVTPKRVSLRGGGRDRCIPDATSAICM